MKIAFLATATAIMMSGCGGQGEAKDAVKKLLNDPDSAQFSELKNGKDKGDVCGMVNAKNRMGGYVGATPFFYQKLTESAAIVKAPEDSDFRSLWLGIQAGNFESEFHKLTMQCRLHAQWSEVCTTPHPEPKPSGCVILDKDPKSMYEDLGSAYGRR